MKPENLQARGGVWFETGAKAHVAFQIDDIVTMRRQCNAESLTMSDDEPRPDIELIVPLRLAGQGE